MVDDIGAVHAWTQRHLPQRPVFLLGHSMESFLTLRYLERGARGLAGAILSGSGSQPLPLFRMGIWLAAQEMRRDPLAASPRLMRLTFAGFNRGLTPRRTAFDWLSRDPHAVDAFIQDPYCGAVMPAAFFYWFFRGLADTLDPRALRLIPHDLPMYLFSGARDPVGGRGLRGLRRLIAALRRHGVRDLTVRIYPGGRHEMLQETNRDEVLRDLVAWLDRHLP
ncbi:hypothetical protein GCM10010885_13350 [Alicyclobacillus cellulosilyticus]|uniref:Serine aminopeptidase S33 domain-containing protein n=2 Tax=Alicyclobacillus cellulosilyticus TaxID=1003997 RepID=A0A917KBH9_9BACL|nr:hypothetical protein GCM10010885_13350 [Alicyclobacillus cellulosilyticus]